MPHDFLPTLREQVRRIERPVSTTHGVVPFGIAAIDSALPGGGLARGALHEILGAGGDEEDGALAAAFTTSIVARLASTEGNLVLWCLPRPDLYGPGLAAHRLDPARLVMVRAARDAEILWAMEEGPHTSGVTAVVGELGTLSAVASRRLQLAAERSGATVFVLRRWRNGGQAARERILPNAAATRWRIAALPSRSIAIPDFAGRLSPPSPPVTRHPRASERLSEGKLPAAELDFRAPSAKTKTVMPGFVPGIHAPPPTRLISAEDVDAHGTSPWAEGPRDEPGHDDGRLLLYAPQQSRQFPRTTSCSGERNQMEPGIGHLRWRVELLRCRGGKPACWEVEIREGKMADATNSISLVGALADRPKAPIGSEAAASEKICRTG